MVMRKSLSLAGVVLCIFAVLGAGPAFGDWEFLGLGEREVSVIELHDGFLFAGTDAGIYKKDITSEGSLWSFMGLGDESVEALLVFSPDTMLVAVYAPIMEGDTISLYRTTDGGANWLPFQNGFGGEFEGGHQVMSLARMPNQSDTLFATGYAVIARSLNGGQSWEVVWGGWAGFAVGIVFIAVDANDHSIVWAGGENGFFAPWYFKSDDYGVNWSVNLPEVGGDNRCHDIAIEPGNSNHAIIPMEGRIIKTVNGGDDWSTLFINDFYLYGIEMHPLRHENLYVCGYQLGYPLTLFYSRDSGQTWNQITENTHAQNGARDILIVADSTEAELYFATFKGIYKYTDTLEYICGDANADGTVNVSDAVRIINYVFAGGDPPEPMVAGDCNCDGEVNVSDAVWIINYVFVGGNNPCDTDGDGEPDC